VSETDPTPPADPPEPQTDPPPGESEPEPQREADAEPEAKPSKLDRRLANLSARLSAAEQDRARMEGELARYRQNSPLQQEPEITPEVRAHAEKLAAQLRDQDRARERAEGFHEAGKAAYADWTDRCSSLMQMGADAGLAELLVEMKDGAKIAGALADDPEALERMAGIRTERGRAISLGMYAAQLADKEPPPRRQVSRAPAPIRPVNGAVRTELQPQQMTSEQLVDYYSREAMARRGLNGH
jgi:hypothetical protein